MPRRMFIALGCVGTAGSAACAALSPEHEISHLPLVQFIRNPDEYVGRTVRVCAPDYKEVYKSSGEWALGGPDPAGHHYSRVLVIPCRSSKPEPTAAGKCITGRVAAFDGSLRRPKSDITAINLPPSSRPWYIHEQCPAAAAAG